MTAQSFSHAECNFRRHSICHSGARWSPTCTPWKMWHYLSERPAVLERAKNSHRLMQSDWADPALRRYVLRHARAARARYELLVAEAVSCGELRTDTDVQVLARMIEVTLGGSFLAWTLYREGSASSRFREDLDTTLRPYLA